MGGGESLSLFWLRRGAARPRKRHGEVAQARLAGRDARGAAGAGISLRRHPDVTDRVATTLTSLTSLRSSRLVGVGGPAGPGEVRRWVGGWGATDPTHPCYRSGLRSARTFCEPKSYYGSLCQRLTLKVFESLSGAPKSIDDVAKSISDVACRPATVSSRGRSSTVVLRCAKRLPTTRVKAKP